MPTLNGKTATSHPKLPGTTMTVAEEAQAAGGKALPIAQDVRDENAITINRNAPYAVTENLPHC